MAAVTSELVAVQEILSVLGRRPVSSLLPADLTPDGAFALARLRRVAQEVMSRGWHWNRENDVAFVPDLNDEIVLPADVCSIDNGTESRSGALRHCDKDLIMREGRVYDRHANTFTFTEPEIRLNLVRLLDFEDAPEPFRVYVTIRAGRVVQDRLIGDPALRQFNAVDELNALAVLQDEELQSLDPNWFREVNAVRTVGRQGAWPLNRFGRY